MNHRIIIGDCREALKALPSDSVHLVVTSPPYNVGIGYGNWKDDLPLKEYSELTETWLKECYRILADGGRICVNLPNNDNGNIAFLHYKLMSELGFNFKDNIAWIKWDYDRKDKFAVSKWKVNKFRFPSSNPILINAYEVILVMQKNHGCFTGERDLTYHEFDKWRYNVWLIPPLTDRTHPAPYPIELPIRLIKLYSLPGQTVLDPFLGSGTTMEACIELKRNSIGIELNPDYVEMIKERFGYGSISVEKAEAIGNHVTDDGHIIIDGVRYTLPNRIPS